MTQQGDPLIQANFLQQCLSHDKRPLGLLLGAGCPMSIKLVTSGKTTPLIPDIAGMTDKVTQSISATALKGKYDLARSHFATDGLPSPNIEELLSHIRSLRYVAGKDAVRGLSSSDLDSLDEAICQTLAGACDCSLPSASTPYNQLANWVGAIDRVTPIEIFTTNYDLLMEEALEASRVPYFDGFSGSHCAFFDLNSIEDDRLPARWGRLWKIHGSLNWYEDGSGTIRRGTHKGKRRVIYPSHLKYDESRRMPYFAMIDRLRNFLKRDSAVLVTVGFSFGDEHLNQMIIQALQGNPTSATFALLFNKLKDYGQVEKLAMHRGNLIAMGADAGVIGTKRCEWAKERDARDCVDSLAVTWLDNVGKPGTKDAQFTLGDFEAFARFADGLTGSQPRAANP